MTQLVWGTTGQRYYEAGVDRGVLYVAGSDGVAWNGLTSVKENPTGADITPFYLDGYKYANIAAGEDFGATIEAFASPPQFAICDGTASVSNGLFIGQQPRKSFGFSYRTRLANDLDGTDYGYKIHLVYNALAAPSTKDNNSLSDTVSPLTLSWDVVTAPPRLAGFRPSAHLVIDSSQTPADLLAELEGWLYGDDLTAPYLPTTQDLATLFNQEWAFEAHLDGEGGYTLEGAGVQMTDTGITFLAEDDSIVDNGDGSFSIPETS